MSVQDRVVTIKQPDGAETYNPDTAFDFDDTPSEIIRLVVPADEKLRVIRWEGEQFTVGHPKSQVEVWRGGASGGAHRVARSNLALPGQGWLPISGAFLQLPTDPALIQWRIRSYDGGAEARARKLRIDSIDVTGVTFAQSWELDKGGGFDSPTSVTLQPGECRVFHPVDIASAPAGLYFVVPTLELMPQTPANQVGTFELWADGHRLYGENVGSQSEPELYPSRGPLIYDMLDAGDRHWELRVKAGPTTPMFVRRAGIFVVNWSEVMAQ